MELSELRAMCDAVEKAALGRRDTWLGAMEKFHDIFDPARVRLLLDVAEAAGVGCRNCSYEDDDAELCRDEAGCGFADAKAALARLKEEK